MTEDAPHTDTTLATSDDPDLTHIEQEPADPDSSLVVMYCGARAWLDDTGLPQPPIDWYAGRGGENATCEACKIAWRAAGSPRDGLWVRAPLN